MKREDGAQSEFLYFITSHFLSETRAFLEWQILAGHYTDFSPERLKTIYEKTGLKVVS